MLLVSQGAPCVCVEAARALAAKALRPQPSSPGSSGHDGGFVSSNAANWQATHQKEKNATGHSESGDEANSDSHVQSRTPLLRNQPAVAGDAQPRARQAAKRVADRARRGHANGLRRPKQSHYNFRVYAPT